MWDGKGRLEQVVKELDRRRATKRDFVADTRSLMLVADGIQEPAGRGRLMLRGTTPQAREWLPEEAGLPVRLAALEQVADKCDPTVPAKFLHALAVKRPQRLADLLNGLMTDAPAKRLVRCLDGQVRALLSDRYRVLDHEDVAFNTLDAVRSVGGEVIEASLTDTHMRLKFTTLNMWDAIAESRKEGKSFNFGDLGNSRTVSRLGFQKLDLPGGGGTVFPLVTVSNSETGHGGYSVQVGILLGACCNGMIFEDSVGKVHLGERLAIGLYSQETVAAEAKAIYLKARDAVRGAFNAAIFKRLVEVAKQAQADVVAKPQSAIENLVEAVGLTDDQKDSLLGYFVKDYDATRFGLAQAVSRLAQDEVDAGETHRLEVMAGRVIKERRLTAAGL